MLRSNRNRKPLNYPKEEIRDGYPCNFLKVFLCSILSYQMSTLQLVYTTAIKCQPSGCLHKLIVHKLQILKSKFFVLQTTLVEPLVKE